MYDIGFVVGKFAPLTRGHIMLINQAATQARKVVIVLSHDQRWLEVQSERDQKVLCLKNRLRWLQQTFAQDKHIEIEVIDETDIPQYPNGWKPYTDMLRDLIDKHLRPTTTEWMVEALNPVGMKVIRDHNHRAAKNAAIFSSEIDYDARYAEHLPSVSHVMVDVARTKMPISATKVRNALYANWDYLPSIVRKDYTLRIVVLGTESVGKTTMVRALAKYFNTSWVEEYGRTYVEQVLGGSEDTLRSSDYPLIAYRHKELEEAALRTANRICLVDTNAFITEFYHRLYEGESSPIVSAIAANEHYDMMILLRPEVEWVADGMRSNPDRSKTTALFESMLNEFPNQTNTHVVDVTSDNYRDRYDQVINQIEAFMESFGSDGPSFP